MNNEQALEYAERLYDDLHHYDDGPLELFPLISLIVGIVLRLRQDGKI